MGKTVVRLVLLGFFLAASVVLGASRLEFPRLALQASQNLGIAITNPNDEAAEIAFTAYAQDGSVLANAPLVLSPNSQVSLLASEVFQDLDLSQVSWFRGQSMSNDLTGFFLLLDIENGQLDGADLPVRSRNMVFQRIEASQTGRNEIDLVNPGTVEAHVTAILNEGLQAQQRIFSIPAGGSRHFDPQEFFRLTSIEATAELEIRSDEDLLGFQLVIFAEGDSVGVNARSTTQRLNTLYFPQIVLGGGFTNQLSLRNQSEQGVRLTISAFGADGAKLDLAMNPVERDLAAGQIFRSTLADLFGFSGGETQTGWLRVESDLESISGELIYRISPFGAAATVAASESGSRRILFSHLATTLNFFTGVALLNPGQFPAAVRGVAESATGIPLGRFDLVLAPGERISRLITELIPDSEGENGGLIWIESDSPVFAAALFGTGTDLLANIPPQSAPTRFRADSSFPERPRVTPRQAALRSGQQAQFSSDLPVTWQVNGVPGGSADLGLVDADGLYLSPEPIAESRILSLSGETDEGVAAVGIDLLTAREVFTGPPDLRRIAGLPASGRVFVTGTLLQPAGEEAGQILFEVIEEGLLQHTPLDFSVRALLGVSYPPEQEALILLSDSGDIYRWDLGSETLAEVTGAGEVTAIAWDPLSQSVLTAVGTSLIGIPLQGVSAAAPPEGPSRLPQIKLAALTGTVTGLAVDRCSGNIFLAGASGSVSRFRRADANLADLGSFGSGARLLTVYRQGVSCPAAQELLILGDQESAALFHPDSETRLDDWGALTSLRDLGTGEDGSIFSLSAIPAGSKIVRLETEGIYALNPVNPPVVEILPTASEAPGLDLEVLSATAMAGQSVELNLFLRTADALPGTLVFSLDIDQEIVQFDDTDLNQDGLPDSVLPLLPNGFSLSVQFDPEDEDGELDVIVADLEAPFSSLETGKFLTISFRVARDQEGSSDVTFSLNPGASAADKAAVSLDIDELQAGTVSVSRSRR